MRIAPIPCISRSSRIDSSADCVRALPTAYDNSGSGQPAASCGESEAEKAEASAQLRRAISSASGVWAADISRSKVAIARSSRTLNEGVFWSPKGVGSGLSCDVTSPGIPSTSYLPAESVPIALNGAALASLTGTVPRSRAAPHRLTAHGSEQRKPCHHFDAISAATPTVSPLPVLAQPTSPLELASSRVPMDFRAWFHPKPYWYCRHPGNPSTALSSFTLNSAPVQLQPAS